MGRKISLKILQAFSLLFIIAHPLFAADTTSPVVALNIPIANRAREDIQYVGGLISGAPQQLEIEGNYAYVAASAIFMILDISDPSCTRQVSYLSMPESTNHIKKSGRYAYLLSKYALTIVDIANPAHPVKKSGQWSCFRASDLAVYGQYVLITNNEDGLHIVDASDPDNLKEISMVKITGRDSKSVTVNGDYAYLTDEFNGWYVIDIKDPYNPCVIKQIKAKLATHKIIVRDKTAYVIDSGLQVYALEDPSAPVEVLNRNNFEAMDIVVREETIFIVGRRNFMVILDISDPYLIDKLSSLELPGQLKGLAVDGDYAYVAADDRGVRIIDIKDIRKPYEIGYFSSPVAVQSTETQMKIPHAPSKAEGDIPLWQKTYDIQSPEIQKKVMGDILLGKTKKSYSIEERKEIVPRLIVDSRLHDVKFVTRLCYACEEPQIRHELINQLTAVDLGEIADEDLVKISALDETMESRQRIVGEMFKRGMEKEAWALFTSMFDQVVAEGSLQWIPYLAVKNEAVKNEIIRYLASARDSVKTSDTVKVYAATILYSDFNIIVTENRKYIIAGACDMFGEDYKFHPDQFIAERILKSESAANDINIQKIQLIKEKVMAVKTAIKAQDSKAEESAMNGLESMLAPGDLDLLFQQEKACRKAAALKDIEMRLTYQGTMPRGIPESERGTNSKYLPIRLNGLRNISVAQVGTRLMFIQFVKNKCRKLKCEIHGITKDVHWTMGDYDNDGQEEIIIYSGKSITIYEYKGALEKGQFHSATYQLKQPIKDLICGDINNDNKIEMVIFSAITPVNSIYNETADRVLGILRYNAGTIEALWMDEGKYRFSNGEMVPPDRLGIITDLDNTNVKKLILYNQRSDVGPQIYSLFVWNEGRLGLEDTFRIEGFQIKYGRETSRLVSPWVFSDMYPVQVQGANYFFAGDWAHETIGTSSITMFKYDGKQLRTIARTPRTYNMSLLVCDPDGQGTGLIKIFSGENRFEFYRVEIDGQSIKTSN